MSKKVPFQVDFNTIARVSAVADWILYLAVAVAAASLVVEWRRVPDPDGVIHRLLNSLGCFFAIAYFAIDLLVNYLFQCAETYRRNDFFDNSLSTVLASETSEEYFTNDSIAASIYKMGINSFENSLFTVAIAGRYLRSMFIKTAVVLVLFLLVALFGENQLLTTVLQLALPLTIIQQTIRLFYFKSRMDHIHDCFKRIFAMPKGDKQDHLLIHNVTNYEAILAWASIKLPDRIFHKMNPSLSIRWTQLKQRLNIQ